MKPMKIIRRYIDPQALASLSGEHPLLARIYAARGVKALHETQYTLNQLPPYAGLLGIDKAARLLADAIYAQKKILIVGDFDADGATATAVAVRGLKALGAQSVQYIVPNRFEYGYGLTPEIVDVTAPYGAELLVTVDNGISSVEGVAHAKALGMQVLITDHHLPPAVLPRADAIVNPNQLGCAFPSRAMAGVGVMFYVLMALRALLREEGYFETREMPNLAQCLDLVALGTIADVVPLDSVNRILVQQGLMRIRAGQACHGIAALIRVAERDPVYLTASDLGFALGPRLNAAGRLEDMSIGIACLLSDTPQEAADRAQKLHQLNDERRDIESDMHTQAQTILEGLHWGAATVPRGLVLYDPNWHQGVVGILASRVKEQYHRPVICFTDTDADTLKGSARSVMGVHVRDVLDSIATRHPGMIRKFGGHAMAAGLTVEKSMFETFAQAFAHEVSLHLSEADCVGELETDGALAAHELTLETARLLHEAGPWGQHFPEPLFDGHFQVIAARILADKHLKFVLQGEGGTTVDAIAFNAPDLQLKDAAALHLAYTLDINRYKGQAQLQLIVRHAGSVA